MNLQCDIVQKILPNLMGTLFKLTKVQWKLLASAGSNMSQAIILFSLAAIFVPEVVGLSRDFSRFLATLYLSCGLYIMLVAVTIAKKGK